MGIGSWPRPRWLLEALHERLEGRLDEAEFQETADDAVRLAVAAQLRAGVDVVTDGEQRRDNYASFVGGRLDNCQLDPAHRPARRSSTIPTTFARELRGARRPRAEVRHPVVFGPLGRSRPLAVHELGVRARADRPAGEGRAARAVPADPHDVARVRLRPRLPPTARTLADDVVRVLREEIHFCSRPARRSCSSTSRCSPRSSHGRPVTGGRSFMCGALGEKKDAGRELAFARGPDRAGRARACRASASPCTSAAATGRRDESAALTRRLRARSLPLLRVDPGRHALPRALHAARRRDRRPGGPARRRSASASASSTRSSTASRRRGDRRSACERAVALFGPERVLLHPDCGFATFADNPIVGPAAAEAALRAIRDAADLVRGR